MESTYETQKQSHLQRSLDAIDSFNDYLNLQIRHMEICINQTNFSIKSAQLQNNAEDLAYQRYELTRFESQLEAFKMSKGNLISMMQENNIIQLY